ncbi:MAG: sigma-70 family RNA polymerase sigma factor [Planctomycetes bacterium]|nr:sigma-70 family RNA polymerase sigma factor [Planctomycetota bacterium]
MPLPSAESNRPTTTALADAKAESLTRSMVGGDRNAYAELFVMRCDFVERMTARALGHRGDLVPDAAQDAWIRVARKPVHCPCAVALDAWLRRVASSAAIDLLRNELSRRLREQRVARSRVEATAFLQDASLLEQARHELGALRAIPDEDRSLLELRARMAGTVSQIATALGIGTSAIDSRLRRATERARQAIEGVTP